MINLQKRGEKNETTSFLGLGNAVLWIYGILHRL